MRSKTAVKTNKPALVTKPESITAEQKVLLEDAIQKREKLAESQLEMAKMFLQKNKPGIARRRLREIASEFEGAAAATEAKALLRVGCRIKPGSEVEVV